MDPSVIDPALTLRDHQGYDHMMMQQQEGHYPLQEEQQQQAESSIAGNTRRSKRMRDVEPVRGEERNLFGVNRDPNTKRTRRQSPSMQQQPPLEHDTNTQYDYQHPTTDASTSFYTNPAHRSATDLSVSSLRMSDPYPTNQSNSNGMDIDDWNHQAQVQQQQQHGVTSAPFGMASPFRGMATYPIGMQPFRFPCLTPSAPSPPPGNPHSSSFQPYDPSIPDYTLDPGPVNLPSPAVPQSSQKYSMGPRADCEKCQKGVQGHYGHWISNGPSAGGAF